MKMSLDDPNLTACALGELSDAERFAMEKAVAASPDAQRLVDETRQFAERLRAEFRQELAEAGPKPLNILPLPARQSFWSDARWMSLAAAALLAVGAVMAAVVFAGRFGSSHKQVAIHALPKTALEDVQMEVQSDAMDQRRDFSTADYEQYEQNPFVAAASNPRSTFSLNVGTASYAEVRRFIERGSLPPRAAVQIEELVNAFAYDYPEPGSDQVCGINLEVAGCPWAVSHRLVRIGLKGGEMRLKDLKVQVEFNPARVASYRLIGYEKRTPQREDLRDNVLGASEPGAGNTVTALYEVLLVGSDLMATPPAAEPASNLLTVKLRPQLPNENKKTFAERGLIDKGATFDEASADFKFAAAVAEFGMILRRSSHKGEASLGDVLLLAEHGEGRDDRGDRAEFIDLVRKAQTL